MGLRSPSKSYYFPTVDKTIQSNFFILYNVSFSVDDMINESPEIMLEDLAIESLDIEDKKSLSIEQAQELIPQEALKFLKEKFNGHLENCRSIQDFDRLI